ncbi:MAG: hypothetical protein ACRELC_00290 [Gemmatimonadota bacterium]
MGTLVCCALPALLVFLGFGATVAAAVSVAPWLVVLSRHKEWVFLTAGLLIAASRLYARHVAPRAVRDGGACPLPLGRATGAAWWASVAVYAAGAFVAFVLGPLLTWLDA